MWKNPCPRPEPYVYVLVRKDLPQPVISVQASHAVLAATLSYGNPNVTHPNLVLCAVDDERALEDAFESLKAKGIPVIAWREDSMHDSLTAIAMGLLFGEGRQPLRHYPLLR